MSMRINTNTTALNALRNLEQTANNVSTSIERLSSGLRINRASDDPAGLIISEGLRAQIDGINQAISNTQDANNLIKTAEGGLSEVNLLLRSIRQLALHASNTGVNDGTAVQADQTQISSALASINRIADQTQYGTKKLLDGTSGVSSVVTNTSNLAGISIGGTYNGISTVAGDVTVVSVSAASRATLTSMATYTSLNSTLGAVNGGTNGTAGTMVINGQSISLSATDTVQTMLDKVNNMADITGVSAQAVTAAGVVTVQLTQQNYGSQFKINYAESSTIISANPPVAGTNATAVVQVGGVNATFISSSVAGDSGLRLIDQNGNSLLLTEKGNNAASTGKVATVSQGALKFQIGSNSGQFEQLSISDVHASVLGTTAGGGTTASLKNIDVTNSVNAASAIKVIDEAITQISVLRAKLGAFQKNTLDSTQRSLGITAENLSSSESQIRDTNVAQEVVSLTKNQILQQAGMSVLSQANQAPQQVLNLLK